MRFVQLPMVEPNHPMMKSFLAIVLTCFCLPFIYGQSPEEEIAKHYKKYLLTSVKVDTGSASHLIISLKNFNASVNTKEAIAKEINTVLLPLTYTRALAIEWLSGRTNAHDSIGFLLSKSTKTFLTILNHDPKWSLYQFEVARIVADIAILVHDTPSADIIPDCTKFLKAHKQVGIGIGNNALATNELTIHYAALAGDSALISKCWKEVVKTFIDYNSKLDQPGTPLEIYGAGRSQVFDHIRMAWTLNETRWAYPQKDVLSFTDLLLNRWQYMARGIYTVPGPVGNSVLSVDALTRADLRALIPLVADLVPERKGALQKFAAWQQGEKIHSGNFHWTNGDLTSYHRPDFSFFVKTISGRTPQSVAGSTDALNGHLLNAGDTYFIRDGKEYLNLMPCWNWRFPPGTTSFNSARLIESKDMTGNVSNGKSGLTSMQVTLKDGAGKQHLSAQKIWATHQDIVVCLTGNVEGHISGSAFTTLDQCRWRGDVTVNAPGNILKEGIYKSAAVKWIHHAGFAYITFPFYETKMEIELKTSTGNWSDLSKSNPQRNVTEKIFHAKIDHGHTVNAGYTGYIVVPAATALEAQQLAATATWGILRGNNNCLSVIFDEGTIMTAFFNAMALKNERIDLEVNRPCLVLIADGKLYVSNFTSAPGERIRISWNKTNFEVVTSSNSEPILAQRVEED